MTTEVPPVRAQTILELRQAAGDDGYVAKSQRDRCLGLVHDDFDGVNPGIGHHVLGDLRGDGLDEVARRTADDIGCPLGQYAVVEGVGQVVAGGRGGEVDPDRDVDDEVLAVAAFVVEDAVVTADVQALQFDAISHRRHPRHAAMRGPP